MVAGDSCNFATTKTIPKEYKTIPLGYKKVTQKMANNSSFDSHLCQTIFYSKLQLSPREVSRVVAADATIMLLNILLNATAINCLRKTYQLRQVLMRLVCYISVVNGFSGSIIYPLSMVKFTMTTSCTFDTILQFFAVFLIRVSFYKVALLAIDRLLFIRKSKKFDSLRTKKSRLISFFMIASISLVQAVLLTLGTMFKFFEISILVNITIDALYLKLLLLSLIYLSWKLWRNGQQDEGDNRDAKSISNDQEMIMTCRILLTTIIFLIIHFGLLISYLVSKNSFLLLLDWFFQQTTCLLNPILFIGSNKKSRDLLMASCCRSRRKPVYDVSVKFASISDMTENVGTYRNTLKLSQHGTKIFSIHWVGQEKYISPNFVNLRNYRLVRPTLNNDFINYYKACYKSGRAIFSSFCQNSQSVSQSVQFSWKISIYWIYHADSTKKLIVV